MTAPESRAALAMLIARKLVEDHIEIYGMVPHPDRIKEAIAEALTTSADADAATREALEAASKALSPLADAVYNDNGDITVSMPLTTGDSCIAAYFARKKVEHVLRAPTSALVERMGRAIEAARKIKPAWDDSNVAVVEFDILIETLAEALRALGETGET